ncbi:MAG: PTS fructose transporter subunit IIA [Erysipelotrichaceae bacterium]|nr:PTS fructose transporter subunit IIA [Erysipelotrichaceae bacterium]
METGRMLCIENIYLKEKLNTKDEVLHFIGEVLWANKYIDDKEKVYEGYIARESEGTTGFGDSFAIPHCKSSAIHEAAIVVITLNRGIEWQAMDGKPVDFVIALAIPESLSGTLHLELLGKLASNLMEESFTEGLRNAKNKEELFKVLKVAIEEEEL